MLRTLVLLFLLLNAALFFWLRAGPHGDDTEREPQRLQQQVAPDSIRVLPDLPAAAASAPAAAASAASAPASGVVSAAAPDPGVASAAGLARKTTDVEAACYETGPLDTAQWTALAKALAKAGVPADAVSERRQAQPGRWMVYMGRYTEETLWQHKADELKRLGLKFDRVSAPPGLDPGLSLGSYTSPDDATAHLEELARRGVHTARIVETTAPSVIRRLQVRSTDDGWRNALGAQRFSACRGAASASL